MYEYEYILAIGLENIILRYWERFIRLIHSLGCPIFYKNNSFFQCHKVIVSASSPVLKAMMMSKMVEATQQEVTLDNILPEVMELLIEYMYKGTIHIPNEHLFSALEACDYLQMLELEARCVNQAPKVINISNIISWQKLAHSLNIDRLITICSEFLAVSLSDVSKESEFLELSLTEVNSCISDAKDANADSDEMLEVTMNWVACKREERQDHILDMLEKIDLTRCSIQCIDTEMDKHNELLYAQPAALGKLMKSLIQIASQLQSPPGIRRKWSERERKTIIVIPGQEGEDSAHNECWHLHKSMKFVEFLSFPFNFAKPLHSVCSIPGGFVVSGGKNSTHCTMFILASKSWKQLKSLPAPRHKHGSIIAFGKIYLFGGILSYSYSSSVISLELEGGKWNQEQNVPISYLESPEVACLNSSIFLLDLECGHQLLQFDVKTSTWSTKAAPPPKYSTGPRMISVKDHLLVTGGRDNIFAWYDPTTDTWTTGNPPTIQHHLGALVHHNKKVYLIGGKNEDRVEEYDLDTESWSVCNFRLPKRLQNLYAIAP